MLLLKMFQIRFIEQIFITILFRRSLCIENFVGNIGNLYKFKQKSEFEKMFMHLKMFEYIPLIKSIEENIFVRN